MEPKSLSQIRRLRKKDSRRAKARHVYVAVLYLSKALPQRVRHQAQIVIVLDASVPDRQESDSCDTFLWMQLTFHLSAMILRRNNEPGSMKCTPLAMTDSFLLIQSFSARGTLIIGEQKKWQVSMKILEKAFLLFLVILVEFWVYIQRK